MSKEVSRELFVKAWKHHVQVLGGLALQAPIEYQADEFEEYLKLKRQADEFIERIAAQVYGSEVAE